MHQLPNFQRFSLPDKFWKRFFWLNSIYLQASWSYMISSDDTRVWLGFCDFLVQVPSIFIFLNWKKEKKNKNLWAKWFPNTVWYFCFKFLVKILSIFCFNTLPLFLRGGKKGLFPWGFHAHPSQLWNRGLFERKLVRSGAICWRRSWGSSVPSPAGGAASRCLASACKRAVSEGRPRILYRVFCWELGRREGAGGLAAFPSSAAARKSSTLSLQACAKLYVLRVQ